MSDGSCWSSLPNAQISYDRFHVVALANAAMDEVRREEMRNSAEAVREAVGVHGKKTLRQLLWGMRKDSASWTRAQFEAMHWLQRSNLKSARAWRLKQALRLVYSEARDSNSEAIALGALTKWMSWARRSREMSSGSSDARYARVATSIAFRLTSSKTSLS